MWKYKSAALFFALLSCYMIACAIVCAVQAARSKNSGLYGKMILSVISTYGLWVAASILAFDPAHLFTSGIPYLLLSPSYIIILNTWVDVFFAYMGIITSLGSDTVMHFLILMIYHGGYTIHEVFFLSLNLLCRGTKQQGAVDNDLGVVSAQRLRKDVVEVELPTEAQDVDSQYLEALENLRTRKPIDRPPIDLQAEQIQVAKDYYANIRTNVRPTCSSPPLFALTSVFVPGITRLGDLECTVHVRAAVSQATTE